MCERLATRFLIDGPGPDDYTLSCDEHEEAMKSDTHVASVPYDAIAWGQPHATCCFIVPGSHERIRARFLELLAADEPDHPWVRRAAGMPADTEDGAKEGRDE